MGSMNAPANHVTIGRILQHNNIIKGGTYKPKVNLLKLIVNQRAWPGTTTTIMFLLNGESQLYYDEDK